MSVGSQQWPAGWAISIDVTQVMETHSELAHHLDADHVRGWYCPYTSQGALFCQWSLCTLSEMLYFTPFIGQTPPDSSGLSSQRVSAKPALTSSCPRPSSVHALQSTCVPFILCLRVISHLLSFPIPL